MKPKQLLFLLSVLIVGLSCSKSDPLDEDDTSVDPKQEILKVMSYNIHIGNPPGAPEGEVDLEGIAEVIRAAKPDLVALQEVDRYTDRSGKDLDQAKALGELTGMHAYFVRAMERSNGEYGVAILSKFPIENPARFPLPIDPDTDAEPRVAGMVQVQLPNKKKILFAATHLDHKTESTRKLQSRELLKALKSQDNYPIIIGGDFNMTPESDTWDIFKGTLYMGCRSCPYTFSASDPYKTVDYILLNAAGEDYFEVKSYEVIQDQSTSDHLPLLVELEYVAENAS